MAHDDLPTGGSVGYEVFDRSDSLTSNQFQQQMNQLRALEGELGRTIRTIRGVRNARVHLVMAKRQPFEREQQEAKASIVIAMAGAQRMGDEEVQAIVNLVATAVPGLKTQNISVIDSRGELLARPGRAGPDGVGVGDTDPRRAVEQRLEDSVEEILGRTLGPGHVRAEATVEMDFDRVNETQELFDPDKQVARRQQTVTDTSKSTEPQASVSVQNNLPNPDTQNGSASRNRVEPPGGEYHLRDRQDRPDRGARHALHQEDQHGGAGGWHDNTRAGRQAGVARTDPGRTRPARDTGQVGGRL